MGGIEKHMRRHLDQARARFDAESLTAKTREAMLSPKLETAQQTILENNRKHEDEMAYLPPLF